MLFRRGAPEHIRAPVDVIDGAHQIANRREIHHPPQKLLKHTDNDSVDRPVCSRPPPPLALPPRCRCACPSSKTA